ncbi:MAG TPA: CheR family methyltransferase [Acetobacteraceae bacterium]|nr:CheR family methyltransferase [Acetobacteraceae bacterium]
MPSLTRYCRYLFDEGGMQDEAVHLIDSVTTNKADFFREPEHFRVLRDMTLPQPVAGRRSSGPATIKFWSAASLTGAEVYTLTVLFAEFAQQRSGLSASILGTDISTEVLRIAVRAIYPEQAIAPVPMELRRRCVLRSRDASHGLVRIVPALRRMTHFARLNLMEAEYPVDTDYDAVFCRNILIYFEPPVQQEVLSRLCRHLHPGGYLFLGHTEPLAGFKLQLQSVASTVFRRA